MIVPSISSIKFYSNNLNKKSGPKKSHLSSCSRDSITFSAKKVDAKKTKQVIEKTAKTIAEKVKNQELIRAEEVAENGKTPFDDAADFWARNS